MRTTLTIDDDIAALIEQERRRSGASFKGTVNSLLQRGLGNTQEKADSKPFVVTPFPLGIGNCDKISELLEELEGPYHR
ncbi:MAG: hypothetical protein WB424_14580 [Terracidiphilus sp.]